MGFFPGDSLAAVEARLKVIFGYVPAMFRLQGAVPEAVDKEVTFLQALLGKETGLSRRQKEQMLLTVAAARGSQYGVSMHRQMLLLLGVSETLVTGLIEGRDPPGNDGVLTVFARKLAADPGAVTQVDIDALRACGLEDPHIVEAVLVACCGILLTTIQFGTGALPDFVVRTPVAKVPAKIPHPSVPEPRPIDDGPVNDPDAEWVSKVQAGDTEAFAVLVDRHSQRVFRLLAALLGNVEEARDALQDTFIKAFRALPAFEGRAKFSTWLIGIAQNTGLQRLRERRPHESLDDTGGEEFRPRQIRAWDDDPEQRYSKAEVRAKVERAIAGLPAPYRIVLVLRDIEQVSTKDAAAALGLSLPALKARLIRGRLMLREALAPHFTAGAKHV